MTLWFLENTSTFKQKERGKHIFPQYQYPAAAAAKSLQSCLTLCPKWDQKDWNLHVTFYYTDAPFVVGQDTTVSVQLRYPPII